MHELVVEPGDLLVEPDPHGLEQRLGLHLGVPGELGQGVPAVLFGLGLACHDGVGDGLQDLQRFALRRAFLHSNILLTSAFPKWVSQALNATTAFIFVKWVAKKSPVGRLRYV